MTLMDKNKHKERVTGYVNVKIFCFLFWPLSWWQRYFSKL